MARWGFLTSHARVLLCVAHDPAARLRDIGASLGISERSAHGIVADLAEAGYVIKQRDGRRNRYQVQADLPVPGPGSREPAVGEVVALFAAEGRLLTGTPRARDADASGSGEPAGPGSESDPAGAAG
jgi:MarR family